MDVDGVENKAQSLSVPFSSFSDPAEVARAHVALERAWSQIKENRPILPGSDDVERLRLAVIIAGYIPLALSENDLVALAIEGFSSSVRSHKSPPKL